MLLKIEDYQGLSDRTLLNIMVAIAEHLRDIARRRRLSAVADSFDTAAHMAQAARRKGRQKVEA